MVLAPLAGLLMVSALLRQEGILPLQPRPPLPRPVAGAPLALVNQNLVSAGTRTGKTLSLALDIVEAAYQPEGESDPIVRILAFAEPGKAPSVPGPLLRAEVGTTIRLTVRNRTDSALVLGGLRRSLPAGQDTLSLAAGATREVSFTADRVGNWFYWGARKGATRFFGGSWLTSQLAGALIVDAAGAGPLRNERIWVITEADRSSTCLLLPQEY